jgi:uncharacterized membrane protein
VARARPETKEGLTVSEPRVPPPPAQGGTVSQNRGLMIALSYLWLLALVPLLVEKDDREVQWHAKHGIVLMVAELILWVAIFIIQMVAGTVVPILGGCVTGILGMIIWVGIIVFHILCIVKGVNGQRLLVPGVSQYADRF